MRRLFAALLLLPALRAAPPTIDDGRRWLEHHRVAPADLARGGASLFILGAFHGVAESGALDLEFLRALHGPARIRTYLAEISHAHALWVDRYLDTGDERNLDVLAAGMRGFADGTREQRRFWTDLRRWNLSLPPPERVRVIGVDFERYAPEISRAWQRENGGKDDFDSRFVDENLRQREFVRSHPATFDRDREEMFYANLLREARHRPLGGIFGRLGTAHALQRPFDGLARFGVLVQRPGSPWRGAAVTIFPVYDEGRCLAVKAGVYRDAPCQDAPELVRPFAEAARGDRELFVLAGPGSPFERNVGGPGEAWTWERDRPRHRPAQPFDPHRLFGGFSGEGSAAATPYILYLRHVTPAHALE